MHYHINKDMLVITLCAFVIFASLGWCVWDTINTWRPSKRKGKVSAEGKILASKYGAAYNATRSRVINFRR